MSSHAAVQARVLVLSVLVAIPGALAQNSVSSASRAAPQDGTKVITLWRVGDPWTGDTPDTAVAPSLELSARKLGYGLRVETFPVQGFASLFFRAFENHQPPDILVFNNYGVLQGISTPKGSFTGIATDPAIGAALLQVTESLAGLGGPGWEYLVRTSPNHEGARALALRAPECAAAARAALPAGLDDITMQSVHAYLENDPSLRNSDDPDRLYSTVREQKNRRVETIKTCAFWGTDHLAFVPTVASYTSAKGIGWISTLLVMRKQSERWKLLAVSSDLVTNRSFVNQIPAIVRLITKPWTPDLIAPPTLVSPHDGEFPVAAAGARFGDFAWHPSASAGEVAEIAEFSYNGETRLFAILFSGPAPATEHCSAGMLMNVPGKWRWRVWSISEFGTVSLSQSRSFSE